VAQQLTLDLGRRPAFGRDDFLVTPSNSVAVGLVDQWPQWPAHAAVIVGASASGKSHLGVVWQQKSGASMVSAADVKIENVPVLLAGGSVLVEDLHADSISEPALFHLLNHARQSSGSVLMTAITWPLIGVTLPDLKSRLSALPVALILPPDDALLRGVLVKHFNDRQIVVDEALINYLVMRMPRSHDVARQLVARIDVEALQQGANVTRAFASKVLASFENPELL
jgi:chromosomal replication initiation ATPase DnaA